MKPLRIVLLGAFALLASCEDASGPNGLFAGTVAFNFTGAGGGSFDATGGIPLTENDIYRQDWAVGGRDETGGTLVVTAVRAQGSGDFDQVLMTIPRLTPGAVTIETCTTLDCPAFAFTLGAHEDNLLAFDFACMLTTGTLTIVTISSSRATGTFSGTGTCTDPAANDSQFIVNGGTFDVVVASGL